MNPDDQNDDDVRRMIGKRSLALTALDDYIAWHYPGHLAQKDDVIILRMGLSRDILRGTEYEVDYLFTRLEEKNHLALMEKMSASA